MKMQDITNPNGHGYRYSGLSGERSRAASDEAATNRSHLERKLNPRAPRLR